MIPEYTIRPANPEDYWYCYQLTKTNMLDLFTRHWGGWVPAKFREGFDVAAVSIIVIAGRRVGYSSVKRRPYGLYVDNIQLSRPLQGRGLGTIILKQLIADNPTTDIHLTTFSDNPARRLYDRLGFIVTKRDGDTIRMSRRKTKDPNQPDPRDVGSKRMMTIRPMTESDDIPVREIVAACYRLVAEPDDITPEQCNRLITERCQPRHMVANRDTYTCHVAEQNDQVVGFIATSSSNIEELFVAPDRHRCGIATALFQQAETDCEDSILTVSTTGFGVPFYEAMGMHVTGRRLVTFGPLEGKELIQLKKELTQQENA